MNDQRSQRYKAERPRDLYEALPKSGHDRNLVARLGRLIVTVGRKRDQGRKTGAAFRAMPNVTGVLVAPILGPYGRNQLSIAVNATHQHGEPSQSPRNPQRLSASNHVKTKDNRRPPLMCGLNQWIAGAGDCIAQREGLRPISPSCRNWCANPDSGTIDLAAPMEAGPLYFCFWGRVLEFPDLGAISHAYSGGIQAISKALRKPRRCKLARAGKGYSSTNCHAVAASSEHPGQAEGPSRQEQFKLRHRPFFHAHIF